MPKTSMLVDPQADGTRVSLYFFGLMLLIQSRNISGLMLPQYSMLGGASVIKCSSLRGLTPAQTKLCLLNSDHMLSVALGAELGVQQCEQQFRRERWNCSGVHGVNDSSVFQAVITKGTPEAAFLYAISSAGVAHAVAMGCMDGTIDGCECNKANVPKNFNRNFIWQGCTANLRYGNNFARMFVDIRETERNYPRRSAGLKRMLMNLHNNNAGRQAVTKLKNVKCRCHGVSGSCSIQSCYSALPPFSRVGSYLKQRHASARLARFNKAGTKLVPVHRDRSGRRRVDKQDLVYIDPPPRYCDPNPTFSTPGTYGRTCVADRELEQRPDSCKRLCCGRKYETRHISAIEPCRCHFRWCCEVVCDKCTVERVHSTCL